MWLERLGTVDDRQFIGFCVVVCVIVIIAFINVVLLCTRHDHTPGRSMTSLLVYSAVAISCAVLFRGVHPKWSSSINNLQPLCPIFAALMVMGYTTFGVALMTKCWALVVVYKWHKRLTECHVSLVAWLFIVVAGICLIIWLAVFSPTVSVSDTQSVYSPTVYQCDGWPAAVGGRPSHAQFAWRVSFSTLFAFTLLLALASLPFHATFSLEGSPSSPARAGLLVTVVLSTVCVVVGLIVWFQLDRQDRDDAFKYAIIGSLQLLMLLVSQLAILVQEIVVRCWWPDDVYAAKRQAYERDAITDSFEDNKRLAVQTNIIHGYDC